MGNKIGRKLHRKKEGKIKQRTGTWGLSSDEEARRTRTKGKKRKREEEEEGKGGGGIIGNCIQQSL